MATTQEQKIYHARVDGITSGLVAGPLLQVGDSVWLQWPWVRYPDWDNRLHRHRAPGRRLFTVVEVEDEFLCLRLDV